MSAKTQFGTFTVNHWLKVKAMLFLICIGACNLYGQTSRVISGNIKDSNGEAIIGAVVVVKGASAGSVSDIDGNFQIKIDKPNATVVVSMISYETKEIKINSSTKSLDVVLSEASEQLDEVVVIGYGTAKKKDLTGSVAHIGKEVTETKVATNVIDFLKGNIAGVNIGINNNAEGGGSIEVRGPASLKASNTPLIVLDGNIFYGSSSDINPNDIESIDVLKDASSAAIYGSKGSAGVIMITTKKGTTEKPVINLSAKLGITYVGTLPDLPTPEQYVQRRMDYYKTTNYFIPDGDESKKGTGYYDNPDKLPAGVTKEQWAAYDRSFSGDYTQTWLTRIQLTHPEIQNYMAGKTTDWRDLLYQTGLRQDYNASISGKAKAVNYYFSIGRTDNEGYKVGDDFKATRARLNLDADITKWLKVGLNAQFSDRGSTSITVDTGADIMTPYGSAYNDDGTVKKYPTDDARIVNPLLSRSVNDTFHKTQTLTASLYGLLTLPYGFTFQTNFNNRYGWRKEYDYTSDLMPNAVAGGSASRSDFSDYEWLIDNMLKWNHTFNDIHKVDVTLVASTEKYTFWNSNETNKGFQPSGVLGFHNMSGGIEPNTSANDETQTGKAFLGRLNYTLADKYLLTASIRRDGFSAFGASNAYGNYPAFALAWRLSEEKFLKNDILDNLKLRFSWGENGNRDIGRYSALSKLVITTNIINGETVTGLWTNNLPNKKLKWERTRALNIGADFSLFKNRLSGVIDLYHNKTTDLILMRALPTVTGFSSIISNLGQVDNDGIEFTLNSTNINIPKKVYWTSTFIYSANNNKIKHLYGNMVDVKDQDGNVTGQREADDIQSGWYIGHGIYDIHDYKMTGIWQIGEEEEAKKYGKQPGDPKLLDVNKDGVITEDDKLFLGSATPRYRMSLRNDLYLFNCLSLSFVLRGEFNYLAADNTARNDDNRFFDRANSIWNPYWTPENPSNTYARLGSNCSNPGVNIYKKRDYVRLQNASIGYSFPKKLLSKFSIENLKVSFNVDNAFVITNWDHYDPENVGTSPHIFTFGVDVTL